jgi:hypothetical protein
MGQAFAVDLVRLALRDPVFAPNNLGQHLFVFRRRKNVSHMLFVGVGRQQFSSYTVGLADVFAYGTVEF